ncbi:cytochrome c oxidase assembly protein [Caldalkalibacillus salinus]|uniref:cytochrome c oxidase assembly protein n=1 Tax=Caldalkalibacillus salinus TaxID=2803787 RepID=UPI001921E4C3|nr:cytochrome c oxidase assembly protein [Caldalkalibacillus salinus]
MANHHTSLGTDVLANASHVDVLALCIVVGAILGYPVMAYRTNEKYKQWPFVRYMSWYTGVLCVASALVGPMATRAHHDFTFHMVGHLLIGMLGPLLLALAAPMTLTLRYVEVQTARHLTSILKSQLAHRLQDPLVASVLNIGGLWVLYATPLYSAMQTYTFLHVVVHVHVFLAGYLFTVAMIDIDPKPHKPNNVYRAIVFLLALTGHGILAKYIYAYPPAGVSASQAELGAKVMYYGGDLIDAWLLYIFCYQWYRSVRPRTALDSLTPTTNGPRPL